MSTAHGIETEVKIRLADTVAATVRLADAKFTVSLPRRFESNTVYDTADMKLKHAEMLLRLRQVGGESIVTWKGPGTPGTHKVRPELETTVGSFETFDRILRALGYAPSFRYEKYRTELARPGEAGHVTIDETPIGAYMELEGPAAWINRTAKMLGFPPESWVTLSYGRLYKEWCEARGITPTDMRF